MYYEKPWSRVLKTVAVILDVHRRNSSAKNHAVTTNENHVAPSGIERRSKQDIPSLFVLNYVQIRHRVCCQTVNPNSG